MAEAVSLIRLNGATDTERLSLKPTGTPEVFEILDAQANAVLGTIRQSEKALPGGLQSIELFYGKGGFMAVIVSHSGAIYFGLPGSRIEVLGLEVILHGAPITGNPHKKPVPLHASRQQTHSPQATILGAGLATRFERISGNTTNYSKPGVPLVGEQTVIECIANGLARHGFHHLIVNTFFKPDSLKASLARSKAQKVDYIDETEPSGTAGGLRKMLTSRYERFLNQSLPLLVVQGDAVTDADFASLMESHIAQESLITIGCQLVDEKDVDKFGIIVTDRAGADGQSGSITEFQEKPSRELAKSRLGNTGFYIFSPKAYPIVREIYETLLAQTQEKARAAGQPVPAEVPFDFATDIFPAILRRVIADPSLGKFWAQTVEGYWSDIGNPQQYVESIHDIYAGKVNLPMPANRDVYYRDGVIFWDGCQPLADGENAQLHGNVIVGHVYSAQ